jgi:hypothetical protein
MEMTKRPSVAEIATQLEAHEAFLKTPEGQEWKAMNEKTVDYIDLIPSQPSDPEKTRSLMDSIKAILQDYDGPPLIPTGFRRIQDMVSSDGFKRGELLDIFIGLPPSPYPKTNFMLNMVLKKMRDDPTFKPVFHFTNELDFEFFDETRFRTALKNMGIESTNPSDHKETKQ